MSSCQVEVVWECFISALQHWEDNHDNKFTKLQTGELVTRIWRILFLEISTRSWNWSSKYFYDFYQYIQYKDWMIYIYFTMFNSRNEYVKKLILLIKICIIGWCMNKSQSTSTYVFILSLWFMQKEKENYSFTSHICSEVTPLWMQQVVKNIN